MAEQKEFRFDLNFQTSNENTFTLKDDKINANLSIKRVKSLIKFDQDYDDNANISLYYNDTSMANDKTLAFYGIKDNKHLIKIKFHVSMSKGDIKEDNITTLGLSNEQVQAATKLNQKITDLQKELFDLHASYVTDTVTDPLEQAIFKSLTDKIEQLILHVRKKEAEIKSEIREYFLGVKMQKQMKLKTELNKLKKIKETCINSKYVNIVPTVNDALKKVNFSITPKATIVLSNYVTSKIDECIYLDYDQTFRDGDTVMLRYKNSSDYKDAKIKLIQQSPSLLSIHWKHLPNNSNWGRYQPYGNNNINNNKKMDEALSVKELKGRIKKTFQPKIDITNVCS
mmetsp:Transcript_23436/g.28723  ORF Transcript_23436/g.28723 Transcript_23436/m.28723 type:complete len:341 (+) Transcript_23436:59-1081(+)